MQTLPTEPRTHVQSTPPCTTRAAGQTLLRAARKTLGHDKADLVLKNGLSFGGSPSPPQRCARRVQGWGIVATVSSELGNKDQTRWDAVLG
uniref:Uncharacterized protein n=1 Tax=Cyanistes caeruleus TaxID=156563 RepID=A0A8C0VMD1_CYACU